MTSAHSRAEPPIALMGPALLAVVGVVGVGIAVYLSSPAHRLHDPVHALQQLDVLYLDEPAPEYTALGLRAGEPALVVVCRACDAPRVTGAQVVVTADEDVAAAYALATADGRIGPGYAIVDARGRVRYRSFDPGTSGHAREIQILLDGVR